MRLPTLEIHAALLALPVVTVDRIVASANRIDQYLVSVMNAECGDGVGSAVSVRFPAREQAVCMLGHAMLQQLGPDASMPGHVDRNVIAASESLMYASVGTHVMERVPRIDQAAGPLAAVGVVLALYSHGPGSPRHDPVLTASALAFVSQAVRIQDILDAR